MADQGRNGHLCKTKIVGKTLPTRGTIVNDEQVLYRASKFDCTPCPLKARCCPKEPARKIPRSIFERARDVARSLIGTESYERSRRQRKKIEMLFAHLKRVIGLRKLRLRGPTGEGRVPSRRHRPKPSETRKAGYPSNCSTLRTSVASKTGVDCVNEFTSAEFFNDIGH